MNNWEEKSVFEFGQIVTGSTPSTKISQYWNGEIPFYSPADFNSSKYCFDTERKVSLKGAKQGRILEKNSILFTCIGSIGKMAISGQTGISNQQINAISVNKNFDYEYVYYLLLGNIGKFQSIAPMTTIPIINKTEFGKFTFSVPKKPHQQKIAKILNTIDAVIEKTEHAITKYQAIKKGMMHDLFTRGIDVKTGQLRPSFKDEPALYKESALGMIPKDWEINPLSKLGIIKSGIDYKSNPKGDEYPIYGTGGIMGRTSKYLNSGPAVLTGRKGTINNPLYIEGKFWNVDTIFCINSINLKEVDIKWLFYNFRNTDLTKLNEATGVPSVNSSSLYKLKFKTPLFKEQQEITLRLSKIDLLIEKEQKTLAKHQNIKKGLMQDLLTGKVEVKIQINTND